MYSTDTEPAVVGEFGQASLDIDKNKSRGWRPGDEMPEWWGTSGSTCGGLVAKKREGDELTYVPVMCKRWGCDVCSYYRHAWLVRNVSEQIEAGRFTKFWTLTQRADLGAGPGFEDLMRAWGKLRERITRKYGQFDFFWVVETTQAGKAHLHLLVKKFLEFRWLQEQWHECTGDSWVIRFEPIRDKGIGSYLAKYVGKEVAAHRKGNAPVVQGHLFGKSQSVKFSEFMPKGEGWEVVQQCWRENDEWLRKNAVILRKGSDGVPRTVIEMRGPNEVLRAWNREQVERAPPGLTADREGVASYQAVAELERLWKQGYGRATL